MTEHECLRWAEGWQRKNPGHEVALSYFGTWTVSLSNAHGTILESVTAANLCHALVGLRRKVEPEWKGGA